MLLHNYLLTISLSYHFISDIIFINFAKLSNRFKELKTCEGGLSQMCQIVEEYAQKREHELAKDTIRKLFKKGLDFEQIADVLERIPKETVLALYEEIRDNKES